MTDRRTTIVTASDPEVVREVLEGLSRPQKSLPTRLLYDERGSRLFDEICGLEEYYPTRTEASIMRRHGREMAEALGPGCLLIEYGAGSSTKTRILLDHLQNPAGLVTVDISGEHLVRSAEELRREYPGLPVLPVVADFTGPFPVPEPELPVRRRIVYFPGSTIGNFTVEGSEALLRQMAETCGPEGGVLIGVDLDKNPEILNAAYNDSCGVTAAFNLNILVRLNRELGADFDVESFSHRAIYNPTHRRVEMYLMSERDQSASVAGRTFRFGRGEAILTEYSHKYTMETFGELAGRAGLRQDRIWTDPDALFSIQLLSHS